jgi:hypothetical protein
MNMQVNRYWNTENAHHIHEFPLYYVNLIFATPTVQEGSWALCLAQIHLILKDV